MEILTIPCFGESNFYQTVENNESTVTVIPQSDPSSFDEYCKMLEAIGYTKKEERNLPVRKYAAFARESRGVFNNYF